MRIIQTEDGSSSIQLKNGNTYHSRFGAIQESQHIFINNGLRLFDQQFKIRIFELGFGTGLNALLSALKTPKTIKIEYISIDTEFPSETIWKALNYPSILANQDPAHQHCKSQFESLHLAPFDQWTSIQDNFEILKLNTSFEDLVIDHELKNSIDLIYYDPFADHDWAWSSAALTCCKSLMQ